MKFTTITLTLSFPVVTNQTWVSQRRTGYVWDTWRTLYTIIKSTSVNKETKWRTEKLFHNHDPIPNRPSTVSGTPSSSTLSGLIPFYFNLLHSFDWEWKLSLVSDGQTPDPGLRTRKFKIRSTCLFCKTDKPKKYKVVIIKLVSKEVKSSWTNRE